MLSSRFKTIWVVLGFAALPNTIKSKDNNWMVGCPKHFHNRASQGKQRFFGSTPGRGNHDRRRPLGITARVNDPDESFSSLVLIAGNADFRAFLFPAN
jgi:hypothetical protein